MTIEIVPTVVATAMATAGSPGSPHVHDGRGVSALAIADLDGEGHDVALDELSLLGGLAERGGGETVDVPHGAEGGLTKQADGVGGKQLALTAGATHAASEAETFGGVLGHERIVLERGWMRA